MVEARRRPFGWLEDVRHDVRYALRALARTHRSTSRTGKLKPSRGSRLAIYATTFVAGAVVLLILAAVASYLPARRASGVDPITALRAE